MPQLAPEWPRHPLRDQLGQLGAPEGLSEYDRASQEPVGSSQGPSGAVMTASSQYEYGLVYSGILFLFCKHLSPLKEHKVGSVFKIYIWISVFRRKNSLEINLLVLEISNKQTFLPFF